MKKLFILMLTTLFLTGCGVGDEVKKTEFKINENATIDYFNIKCTGYDLINEYNNEIPQNDIFLKVNYKILSVNNEQILIKPEAFFKLYKDGKFILGKGKDITLQKNKEIEYSVVFDTNIEDSYKVLFYSNVVSNNIAFEIK